jgi:hypothetical protein
MIHHIKHGEIDKVKWDNCISSTPGAKPYGYSWYLDIMAPGWEALVADDYHVVFPLPRFGKYGIRYLITPVFLQQLGVFSPEPDRAELIKEFIKHIPDYYRLINMGIGQEVRMAGYDIMTRSNYVLDLSPEYEKLFNEFSRNCKRNIAASLESQHNIDSNIRPSEIISLFRQNKGKELRMIREYNYDRLEKLMNYCSGRNIGKIIGSRNDRMELIYGLFYIVLNGNMTMILLANTPESHRSGTGYYVYNELIKENAGTNTLFDFSGSSIPSIARFMESFGSINIPYYRIYRNRLPRIIKAFQRRSPGRG